jgi:hypothetical protein
MAVGVPGEPGEPAGRHLGIRIQKNHVARAGLGDAAIDRGDEAEIGRVAQQMDEAAGGETVEVAGQRGLGRGVVDDDDPVKRAAEAGLRVPQQAAQAAAGGIEAPVDGDHDIDADAGGRLMRRAAGGHGLGDVEPPFGRQAEEAPGAEMVEQRIGGGFGNLIDVEAGIEAGMRVAALARAEGGVVVERVDPGFQHVRVLDEVPLRREEGVRVAAFMHAPMTIVVQRVDIGGTHIGIGAAVVVRIEVARLGVLRGGVGLRCQLCLRGHRMGPNLADYSTEVKT